MALTVAAAPAAEGRAGPTGRVFLNPRDMAARSVSMGEPVLMCVFPHPHPPTAPP